MFTTKNFYQTVFALLLLFTGVVALNATTITVTNGGDTGSGSLRNAISTSVAGDIIVFSGVSTVTLTSAELSIGHNLTINGGSGVTVKRSGSTVFRIFHVTAGSVTFNDLTISNGDGNTNGGGGLYVNGGATVTMNTCTIKSNFGDQGAGIQLDGTLTMTDCSISNNDTQGATVGGGVAVYGDLTMTNCTVNGNLNGAGGAAIDVGGSGCVITMTNCTVSGNNHSGIIASGNTNSATLLNCTITANDEGLQGAGGASVTLKNTIVADNTTSDVTGSVSSSSSYNLIGTGGSGGLTNGANNNQVGVVNTGLSALANNGGPTQTHAIAPCSPAVNTGTNAGAPGTDQRGNTRPYNSGVSDIGAYELQSGSNAMTVASTVTNVLCNGGATGSIDLSITNGTAPFTYTWTGSGTGTDPRNNLAAGTYTVTVTDVNGCTGTKSSTVTQPSAISITKTSTNVTCNGGNNGSITLTVTGGTGSYSYSWSGTGTGSNPRTGLAAGTYTVTVTDGNNCTKTNATTISQPSAISITATPTNVSCNGGSNGSISLTVGGGGGGFTYAWSGAGSGTNPRTALVAGTYTVTVTDVNNCTKTQSATVSEPNAIAIAATVTDANCPNADGSISLGVTGGTGAYSYSWTGTGAGTNPRTALVGGTYTVTVTDINSCTSSASSAVANIDAVPPSITCPANSSVTADVNGDYTLASFAASTTANDNCTANPGVSQSPAVGTVLTVGTHTITMTATDGVGLTANCTFSLTVQPACSGPTVNCPANATVAANGSCTAVLASYTAAATYAGGCGSTSLSQSPAAGTTLALGTTTVTITATDGSNNTSTCAFTVTVADQTPPSITCPANATVNAGASCTGQVGTYSAVSLSDNCAASPSVTQSPAAGTVLSGHNATQVVTLTANDGNGNTSTCTLTVTLKDVTPPSLSCPANATVSAGASCNGQIGAYSAVSLSDNCAASPSVTQSPAAVTVLSGHNATQVVTLTANDGNGNTSTCTLTVTLKDQTQPNITCPANTTVNANAGCQGVLGTYSAVSLSDNCSASPSVTQSPVAGTGFTGTQTVTLTANDGNGNTRNCTFSVSVSDQTPPSITCPANATVNAGASCTGTLGSYTAASVSDNCAASPSVTQSPVSSTVLSGHNATQVVTLTANDGNGNTSTCTLTVTLKDVTPPSLSCPANATVSAGASCNGQIGAYSAASLSDNCAASPTVTQSPAAVTVLSGHNATQVVTLTANDGNGNTSTCTLTVTLKDQTQPDITCPANTTVNANAGCQGVLGTYSAVSLSDNCTANPSVTQSPAAGTGFTGTQTVTLTANDGNGNTRNCTFSVAVSDQTPPSITCPANATVNAGASCTGTLGSYSAASVSDNCAASPSVTQSPVSSTVLSGHNATQVVTLTANDGNGNTSTCTLTVTLKDVTPPSLSCPANATVSAGASCNGQIGAYSAASLSDNCAANPTITQSPASSTLLSGHNATQVVTLTANDGNGNTSTCTLTVTLKDVTQPSITCPANTTVNANTSCQGTLGTYSPSSVSDNCSASPSVTQSPASGTSFTGTQTVTLTADDGNGNTRTCTFSVAVNDQTPPSITCPSNTTVSANTNCQGTLGAYSPSSVSDNCAASPSVTQSPASSTVLSGHNATQIVTLTANDGNGNTSTCTLTVTLKDVTQPSITCPANTTVNANASCQGTLSTYTAASVSDNCATSSSVTQSPAAGTSFTGTQTVTLTANDGNGNTRNCTFTVTVSDQTPPSITCPAGSTINASAGCSAQIGVYTAASVSDNCAASPSVTQSPVSTTVLSGHNATQVVTLTANDGNGNTSTCTLTVTLKDVTPPSLTCPANATVSAGASCSGQIGAYSPASVSDNCAANPTVTQSPASSTVLSGHNAVQLVTLTANDGNGNTSTCSLTVTLKDVTPPSLTCPANAVLNAGANCSAQIGTYTANTVSDNCAANPTVTQSPASTTVLSGHNASQVVTLTANDGNGNTSTCTLTVTLKDLTPPSLTCPANATVSAGASCSGQIGVYSPVTISDNCAANPGVTQSPASTTVLSGHNATQVVTLTANDGNGNTTTCTLSVTLKDVTPPSLTCPANATVSAGASCSGQIGVYAAASLGDNCAANPTVTQSPASTTLLSGHNATQLVTLTANDGNGNTSTCTLTVTLKDVTKPNISCPANTTLNLNASCSVSLGAYTPTAVSDNCTASPAISQAPASGTLLFGHNTVQTVSLTATDAAGNTQTCTFSVTLRDVTPPSIVCKNITVNLNAAGTASIVPGDVYQSGSDNCGTVNLLSVTPNAFSCLNTGNNAVLLSADDSHGNTSTCTAVVTVKDVTLPVAKCKNITISLTTSGSVTVLPSTIDNGSSDNCSYTLTLTPNIFGCSNLGVNNVVLKATDASGNSATCTARVTVVDNTGPTAKCKNPTIFLNSVGQATLSTTQVDNGSFDACGIASMSLSQTSFNCSELEGSPWAVVLSMKDVNNNSSSCLAYVTVKDAIAPTAICEDQTVALSGGTAVVYGSDLGSPSVDNCSVWSFSPTAKVYTTTGVYNLTITVKDWSGNAATCVSKVTVIYPFGGDGSGSRNAQALAAPALALFPNPTTGDATLAFELPEAQDFEIRVFDMSGRLVYDQSGRGNQGENNLELALNGMNSGLYIVDFQSEAIKIRKRLVIQRD